MLIFQCFSVQEFITFDGEDTQEFHLIPIIAVSVAWGTFPPLGLTDVVWADRSQGVKFALFCYCYAIKGSSSQVQVLWEDHRNDLFS